MGKSSSWSDKELLQRTEELRSLAEGVVGTDVATDPFNTPIWVQRLIRDELTETRPVIEELQRRGYGQGSKA